MNGPCPLLAIANVLLLRNCIHISESAARIATQDLLSLVAEYIVASNKCSSPTLHFYTSFLPPSRNDSSSIATRGAAAEVLLDDALQMLPWLTRGLDVNVLALALCYVQ